MNSPERLMICYIWKANMHARDMIRKKSCKIRILSSYLEGKVGFKGLWAYHASALETLKF
jgi:hypothetical protein